MDFNFDDYIAAFNTIDEEAFVNAFFTEDLSSEGPDRVMNRDEWIGMLKFTHRGVKETLHPRVVVRDGDNLMVEVDAQFVASLDRPDFPVMPLKAGQTVKVRFFATYKIRGGKIARLALAWWPPMSRPADA